MKNYITRLFGVTFIFLLVETWILAVNEASAGGYIVVYGITLLVGSYITHSTITSELKKVVAEEVKKAEERRESAEMDERIWKQSLLERNQGFKTLLTFISEYEKAKDGTLVRYLQTKSHPAYKAADLVKEQSTLRRKADFENKRTQALIEMYEQYAPFLIDLKDEIPDPTDQILLSDYTEEEKQDEVINYLTKEEYRNLSTLERNQRALDRFWSRPKSKWLIGKLYERYIGYLYETDAYKVEYFGIAERYEDLGRDLICRKGNVTKIIQCKNWAQFKTIYEKHIFQLFGSIFEYRHKNPTENVQGILYTTTKLSDIAREMATALGIEVQENFKFNQAYPCIKCNIGNNREKIYHLPFDQKYDDTKIDKSGELYCATIKEAEDAGFRRAFKWRGKQNPS